MRERQVLEKETYGVMKNFFFLQMQKILSRISFREYLFLSLERLATMTVKGIELR